jgi:hypothetical protein
MDMHNTDLYRGEDKMDNLIHNRREEWSLLGEMILSGLFLCGDVNCFRVSAKYGLLLLILLASPPAAPVRPLIRVYRSSSDIVVAWVRRAVIAISIYI